MVLLIVSALDMANPNDITFSDVQGFGRAAWYVVNFSRSQSAWDTPIIVYGKGWSLERVTILSFYCPCSTILRVEYLRLSAENERHLLSWAVSLWYKFTGASGNCVLYHSQWIFECVPHSSSVLQRKYFNILRRRSWCLLYYRILLHLLRPSLHPGVRYLTNAPEVSLIWLNILPRYFK